MLLFIVRLGENLLKIFRQWFHQFDETTSLLEQESAGGPRIWSDVILTWRIFIKFTPKSILRYAVEQLVEALSYKLEGRGIPRYQIHKNKFAFRFLSKDINWVTDNDSVMSDDGESNE